MTIAPERPTTAPADDELTYSIDPYDSWYRMVMPKARRQLAPDDPRHGTTNGYGNFGCRCDPCKAAKAEESRAYNDRTVERRKERYQADAQRYRAERRAYVEANREKVKKYRKSWYRENSDRILAKQKAEYCPIRNREKRLLRQYALPRGEYEAMLVKQDGKCAICRNGPEGRSKHGLLAVDHCHVTGRVRGLLCDLCNVALGGFGDSPEVLQRAIEYLGYES